MIQLENIGVKFYTNHKRQDLKSYILDTVRRKKIKRKEFWALKSITLNATKNEIIGVIGSNGAGKSTLCRVISNILIPDEGSIKIDGMVSALLSLGTGFNTELTGRENVYLNGMMLGFSKKEVSNVMNDILEFADIGQFIDQPIKYYSKGMKSRLGFSIAAMLKPDILVLDEALTTGDNEFKQKASKKMNEIIQDANVVIIVSHDLNFIEEHCSKVVWIHKGSVKTIGVPSEVCSEYKKSNTAPKKKKKLLQNFKRTEAEIGTEQVITVNNLGIRFKINKKDFWALRNVTFTLNDGEILGIIGKNGAGKSTLCKALSNIIKPDEGSLTITEETTELFGFGTGFNPQLTGEDNIYLNGLLLGINKKKLHNIHSDIIEFAELEDFISMPVKTYSSGMKARLEFSIATSVDPQILIIDEALSTGDYAFYQKAAQKIQEIITNAKAVIVVTHNMSFVKDVCTRALVMEKGEIIFNGNPDKAIEYYLSQ